MAAASAALIGQGADAGSLVDDARTQFDEALSAVPVPESDRARLARQLGVI